MNRIGAACAGLLAGALVSGIVAGAAAQTGAVTRAPPGGPPRTIDSRYTGALSRLPDWNGLWTLVGPGIFDAATAYQPPDPAEGKGFDFAVRPGARETIPLKPEYQKLYDEAVKDALEKGEVADPLADCIQPHGMPRVMGGYGGGPEIVITPGVVYMGWDYMGESRRIYTDGRAHTSADDLIDSAMGHSIAHWEGAGAGAVLVVDTVGMYGGVWDRTGALHSNKLHMSERIRLIDDRTLEDEMTLEDPVTLLRPWKVTRRYAKRPPGFRFEPYYCENNRNQTINGHQSAVLAADAATAK